MFCCPDSRRVRTGQSESVSEMACGHGLAVVRECKTLMKRGEISASEGGLARFLEPDQPLVGVRAAGADGYGEPIRRVEGMAARYVAAVRAAQPHGPYYLGGFSFGRGRGSVALE